MAKVLLVGYMREHMEARNNALRAAGYQVVLALGTEAAYQAMESGGFHVAVLGYSASAERERGEIALRLTQLLPNIKIVMMYLSSIKNTELADALIPTTATPHEVVRAVNHVLRNDGRSKTG